MERLPSHIRVLPHDKQYHVFVCYESGNVEVVRKLVEKLEAKEISCCYYERDFMIGESIVRNIYTAIRSSVHMLVVLSENFERSDYCLHEVDEALNLKIKGQYNLIPIKTEPCSVPPCLQHISYIDAEDDLDNASERIFDAIAKRELQTALKDVKNGESLKYQVKPYSRGRVKFSRYRMNFSTEDVTKLWNNDFQVSKEVLKEIEDLFNTSLLLKYLHVWEHVQFAVFIVIFLLLTVVFLVFLILLLTSGNVKVQGLPLPGYCLAVGIPLTFVIWISCSCIVCCHKSCRRGIYRSQLLAHERLRDRIWNLSQRKCVQNGIVFFLSAFDEIPLRTGITFMRYNFKPCKQYFGRILDGNDDFQKFRWPSETKEETVDRLFSTYLKMNSSHLEICSFAQRHKMVNNAECACLLVEKWLEYSNQN